MVITMRMILVIIRMIIVMNIALIYNGHLMGWWLWCKPHYTVLLVLRSPPE